MKEQCRSLSEQPPQPFGHIGLETASPSQLARGGVGQSDSLCLDNKTNIHLTHPAPDNDAKSTAATVKDNEPNIGTQLDANGTSHQIHTQQQDDCVSIIHFNDCYNVEPGPKSSGAAGFLTAVNQHRAPNQMILFSGDIISPSFMSTFTKGEQMIPVLSDIGVHCAVFGNHEFDYGVDNLIDFVKRTNFPWLLSNVIDKETSNQLGDGLVYHVIERCGLRFGLIGLIEEEWLSTLSTLDSSDVVYQDFVTRGRELAKWLKANDQRVDYVIALTHFRTPNDILLADSVPEIDLILGGHDHDYEILKRPNSYIIKSGTDFREFSKITLKINPNYLKMRERLFDGLASENEETVAASFNEKPILDVHIERIDCSSCEQDEQLKKKLEKFVTSIDEKMSEVLGQFNCDLDGRFSSIRRFETNLGNFVTDIMLASTHADLAILNSGTLRSDRVHPKGDFTMRDLFNILGYIDPIAVLQASGHNIWKALENGVSQWPKLEGRFPQISGCSFTFNPKLEPMNRIDPKDIFIGDEPIILDKQYRLTTKAYLASGKDGYDMLKDCRVLVPGDESPDLTTSILNHFESIKIVKSKRRTHHRQSIICLSRSSLKKLMDQTSQNTSTSFETSTKTIEEDMMMMQETQTQYLSYQHSNDDNNNNTTASNTNNGTSQNNSQLIKRSPEPEQQVDCAANSFDDITRPSSILESTPNGATPKAAPAASSPKAGLIAPTPSRICRTGDGEPISRLSVSPLTLTSASSSSSIQSPSRQRTKRVMSIHEMEYEQCRLEPKVEGRIRVIGASLT